jgi:hypothetical protein
VLFCAIWERPWENQREFDERRRVWLEDVKPDTLEIVASYSLQGPKSKGITIFKTERSEDVNLFRNYFALAGLSMDIRVAVDMSESVEVVERLLARW